MLEKAKKRFDYIDIAKGIGIFLVLVGHTSFPSQIRAWIYSFHMPLFFLISGMWYKDRPIRVSLRKTARNYLVPYLIFSVIFSAINYMISSDVYVFRQNVRDTLLGKGPCVVLWYLVSLFCVENLYQLL